MVYPTQLPQKEKKSYISDSNPKFICNLITVSRRSVNINFRLFHENFKLIQNKIGIRNISK